MELNLVSIVLPIYNVEKYLNRCIESIVNQTYKNLEIILVDDGSLDSCPTICEDWARKDERIRVIHKKNAGLGMARNTGIEYATGEYICFFDSDDFVEKDTIVCFGYSDISKNGDVVEKHVPEIEKKIFVGEDVINEFLPELLKRKRMNLNMSAWAAMFSMKLINSLQWRFISEREVISEDVYSLLYLYRYVKKVAVLPAALYNYCENDTSLTRKYQSDRFNRINHCYCECKNLVIELGCGEEVQNALIYPYLANVIASLKSIVMSPLKYRNKIYLLQEILNDSLLQKVLRKIDFSEESIFRKILFIFMQTKCTLFCYCLIVLKRWSVL